MLPAASYWLSSIAAHGSAKAKDHCSRVSDQSPHVQRIEQENSEILVLPGEGATQLRPFLQRKSFKLYQQKSPWRHSKVRLTTSSLKPLPKRPKLNQHTVCMLDNRCPCKAELL